MVKKYGKKAKKKIMMASVMSDFESSCKCSKLLPFNTIVSVISITKDKSGSKYFCYVDRNLVYVKQWITVTTDRSALGWVTNEFHEEKEVLLAPHAVSRSGNKRFSQNLF